MWLYSWTLFNFLAYTMYKESIHSGGNKIEVKLSTEVYVLTSPEPISGFIKYPSVCMYIFADDVDIEPKATYCNS